MTDGEIDVRRRLTTMDKRWMNFPRSEERGDLTNDTNDTFMVDGRACTVENGFAKYAGISVGTFRSGAWQVGSTRATVDVPYIYGKLNRPVNASGSYRFLPSRRVNWRGRLSLIRPVQALGTQ